MARQDGAGAVFLLTTTAERFFPRLGFEPIARAEVPTSVQASAEFQSACPASAVAMRARV
jgi:amino-acid N-acetyltransferase